MNFKEKLFACVQRFIRTAVYCRLLEERVETDTDTAQSLGKPFARVKALSYQGFVFRIIIPLRVLR
jgi:hypothetical protein